MSADKYASIFSRQMKAIVYIFVYIYICIIIYVIRNKLLETQMFVIGRILQTFHRFALRQ